MANNRLTYLYLPVPGSEHGGLKGEVSLVCMLIAFGELHRRKSALNLREVNIVVYKHSENYAPSISEIGVKRALDFVSRLLED
ncbi:MAG: hypothetical protein PHO08_14840 [Methylococcales bacterium]|nr:hypothetical protein [Methylococcales bacterium]MDD5632894.1 hypothetical protein [Methylococcales bacterium]